MSGESSAIHAVVVCEPLRAEPERTRVAKNAVCEDVSVASARRHRIRGGGRIARCGPSLGLVAIGSAAPS